MIRKHVFRDFLLIFAGTSIMAFGIVMFNMANQLAEGGITGITLIIYNLFQLDPAISTLVLNAPLIVFGYKQLGTKAIIYTFIGTVSLSFNLWVWQLVPLAISIDHDLLIAALLAGLFGGIGAGIVYKFGGTTGGTDIFARVIEKKFGWTIGRSLLVLDVIVLILSLSYLDLKRMMYTLIAVFVYTNVVDFVQEGAYSAKGIFVVTDKSEEIAETIMRELERGVTFFKAEGGYSSAEKKIIFCVATMAEINAIKLITEEFDENAFISVMNVNEVLGEGFTYDTPPTVLKKRKEVAR